MNKIQECVEKLLEVIREDSAYQRYLACEEMLKSNPELKKQIDEFRVAVFHMNNDDTQGDLYDITDEVENRYEKLRKVPEECISGGGAGCLSDASAGTGTVSKRD